MVIFTVEQRKVEQLAARRAHNPEVAGSSPVLANTEKPLKRGFFGISDTRRRYVVLFRAGSFTFHSALLTIATSNDI